MAEALPLPAQLSRALVAFTIEFDNEFERRMLHWTTSSAKAGGERKGIWLGSMALCLNVMRLVPKEGIPLSELRQQARTDKLNLAGMARWRYLTLTEDTVRPTHRGLLAKKVWKEIFPLIEDRWQQRFGVSQLHELRTSLLAVVGQFTMGLPAYLPILGYGLFEEILPAPPGEVSATWPLPVLLAKVLLAFALRFEKNSPVSLAVGFLERRGYAVVDSESRTKMACLTPKGIELQAGFCKRLEAVDQRWQEQFGSGLR